MSDATPETGGRGLIRLERVWKKFHLGERYDSLRDLVPSLLGKALGPASRTRELRRDDFWALRDIDLEVRPGKALGVIGGNGAGKSTLLKIITRILRPNRGHCEVRGRIGALIEIAAGFHPDLTGRENVFLQGAIMGMRSAEIRRKFDEIVAFSGVAQFIDTPVKRFSSGMNARLGFAIAAHLDPDVLIIDEVLSVGDFAFQAKAFDRIQAMVRQQIPVVVVSHQLDRIASLCTEAILLERGEVRTQGSAAECIRQYLDGPPAAEVSSRDCPVGIASVTCSATGPVESGERLTFSILGQVISGDHRSHPPSLGLRVRALDSGEVLFDTSSQDQRVELPASGPFQAELELSLNVAPGLYAAETHVWDYVRLRDSLLGPSVTVQVDGGPVFFGKVQMHPTMQVRPLSVPTEPVRSV